MKIGILFRLASAWVGVHYSPHNKRLCINRVPCITVWVTLKGGNTPGGPDYQTAPSKLCECNQGRLACTCKPQTPSVYEWQP